MNEEEYLSLPYDTIIDVPEDLSALRFSRICFRPRIEGGCFAILGPDNEIRLVPVARLPECSVETLGPKISTTPMLVSWPDGRTQRVAGVTGYVNRWEDSETKRIVSSVTVTEPYPGEDLCFDDAIGVSDAK